MTETLLLYEPVVRLGLFLCVLVIMALWEASRPRRSYAVSRSLRWPGNLSITALNTSIVRLLVPVTAVGLALLSDEKGWGLLNQLDVPTWAALVLSLVILDLATYLVHVLYHAVPIFWRFHRMHHSDLEFDVTTGVRFHPVEILVSTAIRLALVLALGPPAIAVLAFEIALNSTSMFNHGNVRIPRSVDRILRLFLVTPDMHRVHHSLTQEETDSNFGFNLPWWDRLFGTYRAQPKDGHEGIIIGIGRFRAPIDLRLDRMLIQPFRRADSR